MAPETLIQKPGNGCEDKCVFFRALPDGSKSINMAAKQAAANGREFPGSANTLCGGCAAIERNQTALEEAIIQKTTH